MSDTDGNLGRGYMHIYRIATPILACDPTHPTMSKIPRDPSEYRPTTHAGQQRKHRGIDWYLVRRAITDGKITDSHRDECVIFVYDAPYLDDPVGVVANYIDQVILTIEYRT